MSKLLVAFVLFFIAFDVQAAMPTGVVIQQNYHGENYQRAVECGRITEEAVYEYLKRFNSCHQDDDCMRIATLDDSVFVHRYYYDTAIKIAEVYDLLFHPSDIKNPPEWNGAGFGRCVEKICVPK